MLSSDFVTQRRRSECSVRMTRGWCWPKILQSGRLSLVSRTCSARINEWNYFNMNIVLVFFIVGSKVGKINKNILRFWTWIEIKGKDMKQFWKLSCECNTTKRYSFIFFNLVTRETVVVYKNVCAQQHTPFFFADKMIELLNDGAEEVRHRAINTVMSLLDDTKYEAVVPKLLRKTAYKALTDPKVWKWKASSISASHHKAFPLVGDISHFVTRDGVS